MLNIFYDNNFFILVYDLIYLFNLIILPGTMVCIRNSKTKVQIIINYFFPIIHIFFSSMDRISCSFNNEYKATKKKAWSSEFDMSALNDYRLMIECNRDEWLKLMMFYLKNIKRFFVKIVFI